MSAREQARKCGGTWENIQMHVGKTDMMPLVVVHNLLIASARRVSVEALCLSKYIRMNNTSDTYEMHVH